MPAFLMRSMNGCALPSRIGNSRLSSSTMALSIPMPTNADNRCSVVEISTPFYQTGGVAHASNISACGFNFEVIEINPAKDDPRTGRRRQNVQIHWGAGVEANAVAIGGGAECLFSDQKLTCFTDY